MDAKKVKLQILWGIGQIVEDLANAITIVCQAGLRAAEHLRDWAHRR